MMLFNKKEKVEEPKKEFVIKNRIKVIRDKLVKIYDTQTCKVIIRSWWKEIGAFEHEEYFVWGYTLNTKYGERNILIEGDSKLYYGDKNLIKNKSYIGYSWECPFVIQPMFTINVTDTVNIYPKPMVKFTPQEIDLAILEFESAIEPLYQEALNKESKHKACIEYFSEVLV